MSQPTEIRVSPDQKTLTVCFGEVEYPLSAEYLRVESPSAEVQGHGPGEKRLVAGKKDVQVAGIEPQGNYAVRLAFSDGHSTGIFTWEYFRELGEERDRRWQSYLNALLENNLSREGNRG